MKKIRKLKQFVDKNPIETFKNLGEEMVQSAADEGREAISDIWEQLLGISSQEPQNKLNGELQEGQELDLRKSNQRQKKEEPSFADVMPGIDYRREILQGERKIAQEDLRAVEYKIQEIIVELKKIVSASKELAVEFKEVAIEQRIEKPGKYHINFFEWVLSAVRLARMKVEDSSVWLNICKSKKSQKQYWNMFKKHGTSFGLSNERTVATQTG